MSTWEKVLARSILFVVPGILAAFFSLVIIRADRISMDGPHRIHWSSSRWASPSEDVVDLALVGAQIEIVDPAALGSLMLDVDYRPYQTIAESTYTNLAVTQKPDDPRAHSRFAADLTSPVFSITSAGGHDLYWRWMVVGKQTGRYEILLEINGVRSLSQSAEHQMRSVTDQRVLVMRLPVEVVSELGLSPVFDSAFKLISAIAGLLGAIFGYPVVKAYVEAQKERGAASVG